MYLVCEADTPSAMNAAGHLGLDKGAKVLVLGGPLASRVFEEAAAVGAVHDGLILEITLSTLITDGAL